jgi:hypothetical protein
MLDRIATQFHRTKRVRVYLRCKLEHKLTHSDHLAHLVYLGSVTFAAHEFAHYAEVASFGLVAVHFVLTGWGE